MFRRRWRLNDHHRSDSNGTAPVDRGECPRDLLRSKLGELFTALDQQFPDLKTHLRDEAGEIRRFLNVYVNEEDIRFLGGNKYAFQDGDEVLLVPRSRRRTLVRPVPFF